jgi:hypothetical protein
MTRNEASMRGFLEIRPDNRIPRTIEQICTSDPSKVHSKLRIDSLGQGIVACLDIPCIPCIFNGSAPLTVGSNVG